MIPSLLLAALVAPAPGPALTVMTLNLRYDNPADPHPWSARRPRLAALMRSAQVIGTQEGLYHQVKGLAEDLGSDWEWIGLGRDGGSRGEFMAIFFERTRFEPVAFDHFWLSDTPREIGSASWGNSVRRMVTWVRLRRRADGAQLIVVNTHFDHQAAEARRRSALLLRERIADLDPQLPLVVTGDFNAAAQDSAPWTILVGEGPLEDAWLQAQARVGEVGTFQGWGQPRPGGVRIDWILTRGVAGVAHAAALTDHPGGVWPSDHLPVLARLVLPGS